MLLLMIPLILKDNGSFTMRTPMTAPVVDSLQLLP